MTREEIENFSVVGPYCFETDREECVEKKWKNINLLAYKKTSTYHKIKKKYYLCILYDMLRLSQRLSEYCAKHCLLVTHIIKDVGRIRAY